MRSEIRNGVLVYDQPVRDPAARTEQTFSFKCPGCHRWHTLRIGPGEPWEWSGSLESPSFWPSFKQNGDNFCCHFMVTNGRLLFCQDCTHPLRGQDIPLPALHREQYASGKP